MTKLSPIEENMFQSWYRDLLKKREAMGFPMSSPNPDDPNHYYDFRAMFANGGQMDSQTGHFPSAFKQQGNPRQFLGGIDTHGIETQDEETNDSVLFDLLGKGMFPGTMGHGPDKQLRYY